MDVSQRKSGAPLAAGTIRCAIDIAPLGEFSDPREIVRLAVAAEAAGWDGISIWDSLGVSMGTSAAEPFLALAAVAQATNRLRLITSVNLAPRGAGQSSSPRRSQRSIG